MPPAKLAHVVYRTGDLPRLRSWYLTVLEATVSFENDHICFLTYDDEHHRVALMSDRKLAPKTKRANFDHVAFAYGTLSALLDTHNRLLQHEIEPFWTVNHGPTTSIYYRDPDGNDVELQVDNYQTTEELHGFFRSDAFAKNPIGIDVDVDLLRRRLVDGEPEQRLLLRADLH